MSLKVGLDFGTSNSGVAVYDGTRVRLLPVDPKNILPEVIKTVLYVTRNYRCLIGQEAVETYYRDNVDRQRRYVKQWAGEIDVYGADMHYVRDIYVYVDELQPGRFCNISRPPCAGGSGHAHLRALFHGRRPGRDLFWLLGRADDVLGNSIQARRSGAR
jgi:hypothetical protein